MNKWITADWHLGEDRFNLMQRPFTDVQKHCDRIIENFNSVVGPDDLTYVLGDVLYQKADPVRFLPLIGKMNGKKILVRGNHDAPFSDEQFQPYFQEIHNDGSGIQLDINGTPCYLTHYPSTGMRQRFNLVGHVHGAWKVQLNCLNVGVDAHYLYPMSMTNVTFYLEAITKHYDDDVFAAYLGVNSAFRETRGKKSSYSDKLKK